MSAPIDVARARAETPGCARVLHFNNAGASLVPEPVLQAVMSHLQCEALNGAYEAEAEAGERLRGVYRSIAALLGCTPDEIALTENATRAWDMAFYAIPFRPGDRILTGQNEYASNYLAFLQVARRTGAVVEAIPNDAVGQIDLTALQNALDERVRLIALTHVPTNGGLVQPAAEVGRIAREAGVLYLLDACQSAGQIPLDVAEIGCDILSATGRKYLRGPRGTGFLYVRREILERLEPPFVDLLAAEWTGPAEYQLRPDARRFETWEGNVAGRLGLGAAVEYALGWGLDAIQERVQSLAELLRAELARIPGVVVRDLGVERCGIVSFTMDGCEAASVKARLAEQRINVSTSPASSTLLDMRARGLESVVRASVHYYNTEAEVARFCQAVAALRRSAG